VLFLERLARPLLLLHAVAAGVLVGVTTHHLLACRRYLRGIYDRAPIERRYALVSALAYLVTFAVGLAEYPAYKVRVRAEYFDAPTVVDGEARLRSEAAAAVGSPPGARAISRDLGWVGRLFDVKEHWAALAAAASLALLALSRLAHPSEDRRFTAAYVGLSAVVCSAAWLAALVGIVTTSFRSVGPPS
jgi:hypothetical protein